MTRAMIISAPMSASNGFRSGVRASTIAKISMLGGVLVACAPSAKAFSTVNHILPSVQTNRLVSDDKASVQKAQYSENSFSRAAAWRVFRRAMQSVAGAANTDADRLSIFERSVESANALMIGGLFPPRITLEDDGEIDFVWQRGREYSSLSFSSDGHLVAYHSAPGRPVFRLDAPYSSAALVAFLAAVTMA